MQNSAKKGVDKAGALKSSVELDQITFFWLISGNKIENKIFMYADCMIRIGKDIKGIKLNTCLLYFKVTINKKW